MNTDAILGLLDNKFGFKKRDGRSKTLSWDFSMRSILSKQSMIKDVPCLTIDFHSGEDKDNMID